MAVGAIKRGKPAGWNPRVGRSSLSEAPWSAELWSSGPVPRDFCCERHGARPITRSMAQALIVLRALNLEHAAGNRTLLAALQRVKGTAPARFDNQPPGQLVAGMVVD